jgi:hypothetical protein
MIYVETALLNRSKIGILTVEEVTREVRTTTLQGWTTTDTNTLESKERSYLVVQGREIPLALPPKKVVHHVTGMYVHKLCSVEGGEASLMAALMEEGLPFEWTPDV